ncbi:hypothetical protein D5R40_11770 [Okeania hirsuta]|uniref:Uncharacterized protein n=1 Tax=Okeania hirsuta TaxID=1458930 RepID=A0A3N6P6F5_9CYAN|nr:hypothetical protein D4Z78_28270 [Okeania hirsuta]RQH44339.1 hypothetical protein D5R40_11770 [Okeania hirsuta]
MIFYSTKDIVDWVKRQGNPKKSGIKKNCFNLQSNNISSVGFIFQISSANVASTQPTENFLIISKLSD